MKLSIKLFVVLSFLPTLANAKTTIYEASSIFTASTGPSGGICFHAADFIFDSLPEVRSAYHTFQAPLKGSVVSTWNAWEHPSFEELISGHFRATLRWNELLGKGAVCVSRKARLALQD